LVANLKNYVPGKGKSFGGGAIEIHLEDEIKLTYSQMK
jgi:hypothetical protein